MYFDDLHRIFTTSRCAAVLPLQIAYLSYPAYYGYVIFCLHIYFVIWFKLSYSGAGNIILPT